MCSIYLWKVVMAQVLLMWWSDCGWLTRRCVEYICIAGSRQKWGAGHGAEADHQSPQGSRRGEEALGSGVCAGQAGFASPYPPLHCVCVGFSVSLHLSLSLPFSLSPSSSPICLFSSSAPVQEVAKCCLFLTLLTVKQGLNIRTVFMNIVLRIVFE